MNRHLKVGAAYGVGLLRMGYAISGMSIVLYYLLTLLMGGAMLAATLFSLKRWRGEPMLMNHRWLLVPNFTLGLLYVTIVYGGAFTPSWGIHPAIGFFFTLGLALALTSALVSYIPPHWGGIFVLGMRKNALGSALKDSVKEFDASAIVVEEVWQSRNFDVSMSLVPGYGRLHSRVLLRGQDALLFYEEMLPILEIHLQEFEFSKRDRFASWVNRCIMFTLLSLVLAGIVGWRMGHDIFNFYTD